MSTDWKWSGARWWKFDFHTHTPASDDYGGWAQREGLRKTTPREWLLDYMRAGIDCVAVTDHNSGGWVDSLKDALVELEQEGPDGYRPLYLFPGVEISVHSGIHVLAILDRNKSQSDIDHLLGAVGYSGTKGASNKVTDKTVNQVVAAVKDAGGIAIPAHVDKPKGLFEELAGVTLQEVLRNEDIVAIELRDLAYTKPGLYRQEDVCWTEVLGSDSHHRGGTGNGGGYPGSHYTWVKMDAPTLEGLRLALLDGRPMSVKRSDNAQGDPNEHTDYAIESLTINGAKYIGRDEPFECGWNPFLNVIIGGRGSGKSTLIELMRLVMRREHGENTPKSLYRELEKYHKIYKSRRDDGLLTEGATISLVYRKMGERFHLAWDANPGSSSEPINYDGPDGLETQDGRIPDLFPVSIYSQKQIYELASEPQALLKVIDESPESETNLWREARAKLEDEYLELSRKKRATDQEVNQESALRGQLNDTMLQLKRIEKSDYSEVLKRYQRRRNQMDEINALQEGWKSMENQVKELIEEVGALEINEDLFNPEDGMEAACLQELHEANNYWNGIQAKLTSIKSEIKGFLPNWQKKAKAAPWAAAINKDVEDYKSLQTTFQEQGIDPRRHSALVGRSRELSQRLKKIEALKGAGSAQHALGACAEKLLEHRRRLTRKRKDFVGNVLAGNEHVQMNVLYMSAPIEHVKQELGELLLCDDKFEKDLKRLTDVMMGADSVESGVTNLKRDVRFILDGDVDPDDKRFRSHLQKLTPEQLDRLQCWFPEDALKVTFGSDRKDISTGSPGQKNAALLAFLLSYGEEPLLLDQPEDDLDNELIYNLIVQQLREVKTRRQVIVVTHNANIVVNGDAEMVLALESAAGKTVKGCAGGLQNAEVRGKICEVMEGGRRAFEQRYRRIHL